MPTAASSLALLLWFGWRRRVRQIRREFDLVLAERSRLGREIHDTLLQSLVAVALEFDDISEQLGPSKAALKAQVINIRTRVEQYILEARQTISNLRSPMLEHSDLGTALQRSGESATARTASGSSSRCKACRDRSTRRSKSSSCASVKKH